jgi:hypothetical protein
MKETGARPVKQKHNNAVLRGNDGIIDLPVTRAQTDNGANIIISVWKLPFVARLRFILDGRINIAALGNTHPPIYVSVGKLNYKPPAECSRIHRV